VYGRVLDGGTSSGDHRAGTDDSQTSRGCREPGRQPSGSRQREPGRQAGSEPRRGGQPERRR
jgi:hypothetical protein